MRRIVVFTGTRADWGLLSGICRELAAREGVELTVVATNMHLSERFGMTIEEIRADGFEPLELPMEAEAETPARRVGAMAQAMEGAAVLMERIEPDIALILGDRFEMLAIASACLMMGVPIAHIAGGEISEGAVDDSIRHAITKMSALHFTATEAYRRRVIAMGEQPGRVINTGAIGVWNLRHAERATAREVNEFCGMEVDGRTVIVTYHPATLDPEDIDSRIDALTEALSRIEGLKAVITYPNNDARGARVLERLQAFAAGMPERVSLVSSMGRRRYLRAIEMAGAVVGNSSSGLVEVPSAGTPTVNIGIRQRGRMAGPSVIHCGDTANDIEAAIRKALAPEARTIAARRENPYEQPDTLRKIVDTLTAAKPNELKIKKFHDV